MGWERGGLASPPPPPVPASLRLSMSELGPNYSRLVPHYFSQLLISASKGSLPAVIAKDPSLCAEQAPGTAVRGGAHTARAHARAHTRSHRKQPHTLKTLARALPPPVPTWVPPAAQALTGSAVGRGKGAAQEQRWSYPRTPDAGRSFRGPQGPVVRTSLLWRNMCK